MKKKRLLLGIIVIVVVAGAWAMWGWQRSQNEEPTHLTLYGNVEIRDAQLAFNEQEILSEVAAEEGDTVVAGQVLARLHSQLLEDQLAEAQAQLDAQAQVVRRLENGTRVQEIKQVRAEVVAAKVRVKNARLNLQRLEKTSPLGASSLQALEDARAATEIEQAQLNVQQQALALAIEGPRAEDVAEARARLEANRARVAFFKGRLQDTILKAPAAGIIQSRILEPGETAGPNRPAFILALTDPKWIRTYVSEPDLGRIEEGMTAKVFSDSWPNRDFAGRIGFISSIAEFTPKNVETTDLRTKLTYEVRVWVDDPDHQLRLGMPVTVEVAAKTSVRRPRPAGAKLSAVR